MLGLPTSTKLNKQLPKKAIYAKFNMNTAAKEKFDADIKKLVIANEISTSTTAIASGEDVSSFFVLHLFLKTGIPDEKNIDLISKLINQKMLFILQYNDKARLGVYHGKLLGTDCKRVEELGIQLKGLNLDQVWENIIIQVGDVQIEEGNSLDEQLQIDHEREKIRKKIIAFEKQALREKQPKKKFELVQEIKILEKKMDWRV